MPWQHGNSTILLLVFVFFTGIASTTSTAQQQQETWRDENNNAGVLMNPDERDYAGIYETDQSSSKVSGSVVFVNSLLMSMANCLGVVPFLFVRRLSRNVIGLAYSVACGVMLACSFDLMHEGEPYGAMLTIFGLLTGMICIQQGQSFLQKYEDFKFETMEGADARKTLLVLGIMAAHAIGEGAGVGVSYSGKRGWSQGLLVTLAIGLHNIPEGLATSTVLITKGVPIQRAVFWNFVTAIPQAIFALPAFLFVEMFEGCLPFALGFAAGCMIWVVFSELLPDAFEHVLPSRVATTVTSSAILLEASRMALKTMETGTFKPFTFEGGSLNHFLLISACAVASILVAMAIKLRVPLTSFAVGIGIGMQFMLSFVLSFRMLFWSPLGVIFSFAWMMVGGAFTMLDWRSFITRLFLAKSSHHLDDRGHLPVIRKLSLDANCAATQFLQDQTSSRLLCGLVGLAVVDGVKIGHAFQSEAQLSSLTTPLIIRAVLFGAMMGLWQLKVISKNSTGLLLTGMVGFIPASIAAVMIALNINLQRPLKQLSAAIVGFLLSNAVRLILSRPSPIKQLEPLDQPINGLKTIPETDAVSTGTRLYPQSTDSDDWLSNPLFYQSIGVMFGAVFSFGAVSMLGALCKWTFYCL